ncbi:hypothetical protein KAT08_03010 [Candidatus Babeliales bacterium]|nr:hypothetical protein [Candidatus Babeliales bacterium]
MKKFFSITLAIFLAFSSSTNILKSLPNDEINPQEEKVSVFIEELSQVCNEYKKVINKDKDVLQKRKEVLKEARQTLAELKKELNKCKRSGKPELKNRIIDAAIGVAIVVGVLYSVDCAIGALEHAGLIKEVTMSYKVGTLYKYSLGFIITGIAYFGRSIALPILKCFFIDIPVKLFKILFSVPSKAKNLLFRKTIPQEGLTFEDKEICDLKDGPVINPLEEKLYPVIKEPATPKICNSDDLNAFIKDYLNINGCTLNKSTLRKLIKNLKTTF